MLYIDPHLNIYCTVYVIYSNDNGKYGLTKSIRWPLLFFLKRNVSFDAEINRTKLIL